jgi:hypothetical protein
MWQVCQQGGVSRLTFHQFLQKAEVIPAERDLDEELALIQAQPPPGMSVMGAPVQPKAAGPKPPGQRGGGAQEGATDGKGSARAGGGKPGFETLQAQSGIDHPTP